MICTKNGIPISLICEPSNIHDINTVEYTINNRIIHLKNIKIGGDKGYKSEKIKNDLYNKYKINFITDHKKNSIKKNKDKDINFLRERYIIENLFSWLKNKRRIELRYDKTIKNYEQFTYFAFGLIVENKFKNINFNITNRMIKIYENKIINSDLIKLFIL